MLELVDAPRRGVDLRSTLSVSELAWDSVAVASLALNLAGPWDLVSGLPRVVLDPDRIRTAFTSERHFRLNDLEVNAWAPLSGFWEVKDGWVRVHANYPHHERRLRELLSLPEHAPPPAVEQEFRRWGATELEKAADAVGALAFAVRTASQWTVHPQAGVPPSTWIDVARTGEAEPLRRRSAPTPQRPLRGVRILDMTRVIAGPVAGRTLALAGADVLRVDSPRLPEPLWQHLDTGHNKRWVCLDLLDGHDRATFDELADEADMLLLGYAPAALHRLGLDRESVAMRFPGLLTGYVRAWAPPGPWAQRRGFDSLVQAASGIAMRESEDGRIPGVMPAQALDHSTGYLLAAAMVTLWRCGLAEGGSWSASMSLQRCAEVLLEVSDVGLAKGATEASVRAATNEFDTAAGRVKTAAAAVSLGGGLVDFEFGAGPMGRNEAVWK